MDTAVLREQPTAEMLGVSPRTLQRWRVLGIGPRYRKLGRKLVVYTSADIQAWLESLPLRQSTGEREPAA